MRDDPAAGGAAVAAHHVDANDSLVGDATTPACGCQRQADAPLPSYVYALGHIEPRFPTLSAEKEFAQAAGRTDTVSKTDRQAFHEVLHRREHRYLLRQLCWVFTVQGLETYLLQPADPADLDLLLEAIRPSPGPQDLDVVVGVRGPMAPPELCNGLMVPIVAFDQIYSFDRASFVKAVPRPEKTSAAQFGPVVEEVFDRVLQLTDNAGASDEHRAVNYLAVRYPAIYALAADAFGRELALTGVTVRPSTLGGARRVVEVVFAFTNRRTDFTEKSFVRVDVTEEFPFLVTKLGPYYDRDGA